MKLVESDYGSSEPSDSSDSDDFTESGGRGSSNESSVDGRREKGKGKIAATLGSNFGKRKEREGDESSESEAGKGKRVIVNSLCSTIGGGSGGGGQSVGFGTSGRFGGIMGREEKKRKLASEVDDEDKELWESLEEDEDSQLSLLQEMNAKLAAKEKLEKKEKGRNLGMKGKPVQESACCVWDFSIKQSDITQPELVNLMKNHCKKWVFQLEAGGLNGTLHYQGRMSLKGKERLPGVVALLNISGTPRYSVTSSVNRDNNFYVTKDDTRIDGPWKDTDVEMPARMVGKELRPWQKEIVKSATIETERTINMFVNPAGGIGKTFINLWVVSKDLGFSVPCLSSFKDLNRAIMCMPERRLYLLDLPKASDKKHMAEVFAAIEKVKDGFVWDDRYKYTQRIMKFSPAVWVFSNSPPDLRLLSVDRWQFWEIVDHKLKAVATQKIREMWQAEQDKLLAFKQNK